MKVFLFGVIAMVSASPFLPLVLNDCSFSRLGPSRDGLLASALYRQCLSIRGGCEADISTRRLRKAIGFEHGFDHSRG